ncbi:hypothetical protein cce_1433 [Crocosphaera subtropica ATCC 51142]|uniref:Uncharacterized protein n=1 Tax=Crocosphaera subtropica (strain ATCC 51142 / BH68) TaxID=43989 RepID=B1WWQ9_CROS5|nr:hypothetical protein [Crocosphaera subtropica]ACB50783.1 hypothetical protein cce_1433 [Crocosphaera subtropica ATCC 51142]
MPTLISPLKLAATSAILGLTVFNINPVKAATWVRNGIIVSKDNYSDTRFPGINFGDNDYLAVGQLDGQTGKQVAYLGFDFQSLVSDLTPYLDAGAQIRNLRATLLFNQTYDALQNPNTDPSFPPVPTINIREVDYNSWNEETPIDPDRENNGTIFFGGGISEGRNSRFNTSVDGTFNTFIRNLLQNKTSEFSLAIEPVETFDLPFPPFNTFPGDTLFSSEGGNSDQQPRIDLSFELWNESFKILDSNNPTPNFKLNSLAGGDTFKEHRLVKGRDRQDQVLDQVDWLWSNNTPTEFEFQCSNNRATVTFFANDDNNTDRVISSQVNTCQNIEGLKLFSVVKEVAANTSMEICVDEAGSLTNLTPINNFCSSSNLAVTNGLDREEKFFYFTDPTNRGGLGLTPTRMRGQITMGWENGNNPQEASANQRVAIQLIPLSTYQDPNPPNNQQDINEQSTNTNELSNVASVPESANVASVPESTSVVSFILLGLGGIPLKLSRKNRN